jgi:hypothetical protein
MLKRISIKLWHVSSIGSINCGRGVALIHFYSKTMFFSIDPAQGSLQLLTPFEAFIGW